MMQKAGRQVGAAAARYRYALSHRQADSAAAVAFPPSFSSGEDDARRVPPMGRRQDGNRLKQWQQQSAVSSAKRRPPCLQPRGPPIRACPPSLVVYSAASFHEGSDARQFVQSPQPRPPTPTRAEGEYVFRQRLLNEARADAATAALALLLQNTRSVAGKKLRQSALKCSKMVYVPSGMRTAVCTEPGEAPAEQDVSAHPGSKGGGARARRRTAAQRVQHTPAQKRPPAKAKNPAVAAVIHAEVFTGREGDQIRSRREAAACRRMPGVSAVNARL